MSKEITNPTPFDAPLIEWKATDGDLEALAASLIASAKSIDEINADQHLTPPHVKPLDLVDTTFVLVSAKQFESSYAGQDHAYFCTCLDMGGKPFTTVLGGMTFVEFMDKFTALDLQQPVKVTLGFVKQGKYGGYYVIS